MSSSSKIKAIFCLLVFYCLSFSQTGWFQQTSGTNANLNSIYFLDANTGFAVGDSAASFHIILKTSNGGINWLRQNVQPPNNYPGLKSVFFLNTSFGWACGMEAPIARVLITTNGGLTWNSITPEGSAIHGLRSIRFLNSTTGIAVGSAYSSAGWIFRSTNGGINWSQQSSTGNILHSVFFIDASTGYSCGEPGAIIKTTNSGVNWVTQNSNTATSLRSVYFINPNTGWTVGTNSRIYKTTNGGTTWVDLSTNSLCGLYAVHFTNDLTGWVAGCEGSIHRTTNGGTNWQMQSFASTTYLNSLSFINSFTGWAVGAGGRILKTTTGGLTAIEPISNEIPNEFKLYQNYPNPFNPVTKIKFQIPLLRGMDAKGRRSVLLSVFDILGREITTLVNENLNPGTCEVEWNAADYPSGIYFYKLITINYSETKKIILIK